MMASLSLQLTARHDAVGQIQRSGTYHQIKLEQRPNCVWAALKAKLYENVNRSRSQRFLYFS